MKSFKNYTPRPKMGNTEKNRGAGMPQDDFNAENIEELTKKIAANYEGKNSADMMMNILSSAEQAKRAGTLSNEQIDDFYLQFSPMLNDFQRKKLNEIVKKLKEI